MVTIAEITTAPVLSLEHLMASRTISFVEKLVLHLLNPRYSQCSAQMLRYRYCVNELSMVRENRPKEITNTADYSYQWWIVLG